MTDEQADAAFRVAMEGIDTEMVLANNDDAVWLIDGYVAGFCCCRRYRYC